MNWYTGNIAEAVAKSKVKDAIFVVFIEGEDEMSIKLQRFVDDESVRAKLETDDFVAIKVKGDSQAYGQFLSLYKVVPIPSIFFIGKAGTPLEIATGIIENTQELIKKINLTLVASGKKQDTKAASTSSESTDPISFENSKKLRSKAGEDDSDTETDISQHELSQRQQQPSAASPSQLEQSTQQQQPSAASASQLEQSTQQQQPSVVLSSQHEQSKQQQQPSVLSSSHEQSQQQHQATSISSAAAAAAERRAAQSLDTPATELPSTSGPSMSNSIPAVPALLLPSSPNFTPTFAAPIHTETRPLTDSEMRVDEVQKILEEKRREREEEERKLEKENELRRRREGKESQSIQGWQKEQDFKSMQERIRRERQEELETRERIRAQIAADRVEQARRELSDARMNTVGDLPPVTRAASLISVDETRLQIRLPGGIHRNKVFPAAEPLSSVRNFVRSELLADSKIRDFTLASSYPRREFKADEESKTLFELNLVPNAVVLVLAHEQINPVARTGGSLLNMLTTVMWALIMPAAKAFDVMNKMGLKRLTQRIMQAFSSIGWRQPTEGVEQMQGDAAARRNLDVFMQPGLRRPGQQTDPQATSNQPSATGEPEAVPQQSQSDGLQPQSQVPGDKAQFQQRSGGYQPPRYGKSNIRRLQDSQKDDEEDKATYNGNSTQQQ